LDNDAAGGCDAGCPGPITDGAAILFNGHGATDNIPKLTSSFQFTISSALPIPEQDTWYEITIWYSATADGIELCVDSPIGGENCVTDTHADVSQTDGIWLGGFGNLDDYEDLIVYYDMVRVYLTDPGGTEGCVR
jgi:hypothetical protein